MANKYEKKKWVDRQSQYPSRRKLIETGTDKIYEVERAEGEVTEPGNAFDAANMNDLEDRLYSAFGNLDSSDISVLDNANLFVKTDLEGVLQELFTYASNGKKAIASAIGSNASSSSAFATLAGLITSGKKSIANAIGSPASVNDTFQVLASRISTLGENYSSQISNLNNQIANLNKQITDGRKQIADAIGATRNGNAAASENFAQLGNRIKNDKVSFYEGRTYFVGGTNTPNSLLKIRVPVSFGFNPRQVYMDGVILELSHGWGVIAGFHFIKIPDSMKDGQWQYGIDEITPDGFTAWLWTTRNTVSMSSGNVTIFAYA